MCSSTAEVRINFTVLKHLPYYWMFYLSVQNGDIKLYFSKEDIVLN